MNRRIGMLRGSLRVARSGQEDAVLAVVDADLASSQRLAGRVGPGLVSGDDVMRMPATGRRMSRAAEDAAQDAGRVALAIPVWPRRGVRAVVGWIVVGRHIAAASRRGCATRPHALAWSHVTRAWLNRQRRPRGRWRALWCADWSRRPHGEFREELDWPRQYAQEGQQWVASRAYCLLERGGGGSARDRGAR